MPYADPEKQREYFRKKDAERFLDRREDKNAKARARWNNDPSVHHSRMMRYLSGVKLPNGETKRPFLGFCEICGCNLVNKQKAYHHWDDELPMVGIWVCYLCHKTAEGVEGGKVQKYLELKQDVEKDYALMQLEKFGIEVPQDGK